MSLKFSKKSVNSLFQVKSGDFHSTLTLDPGSVPLISCGDTENGLVGYFDIPDSKRYRSCITVAYNGSPLLTKYHPYEFGTKDDVAVLVPRVPMADRTLFYIAAYFNANTWRFSYGRKCFREKLEAFQLLLPSSEGGIDEAAIAKLMPGAPVSFLPARATKQMRLSLVSRWGEFVVSSFLDIKRGDFHSIEALAEGDAPTVSRVASNNGIVGYFERPDKAHVYGKGSITVSTVGGDSFVQLGDFIATDNILICCPKRPLQITTVLFVTMMINAQKWRYSYGRQCYKAKFENMSIPLPITDTGEMDEVYMQTVVENTAYWQLVKTALVRHN